ncbi:sialate O-acetylesterase [Gaoshiqia sp. Z1-71]|uniref:sialate O-acetylesterase n=1 Tax=Gaoshiqia hydrogeniformans TaxID=3290090 RepID=UPI003BF8ACD0
MIKKNLTFSGLLVIILFVMTGVLKAEVKLPAIFGDHMVLQQQSDAALWGKADPGKTVKVQTSWDKKTYSAQADSQGNWKVKVKTPAAGGPFTINISDGQSLTLKDVLIGEVWVCSGQSNMQMQMKGYRNQPVLGANEAIATSANPSIRLFTVERVKNLERQTDFTGEWLTCEPGNVAEFSATAYFFGKMVQEALGVPVGLICSSWGGTRIEPWMSENGFGNYDWVSLPDKQQQGDFSQQTPTVLFNAMIAPMVGYGIRGGLWYQGESNRNEPAQYEKLMAGLVENWRAEWGIGEFPFYYVQIAPFDYGKTGLNSAYLREAQLKASTAIPNMGMASLMDCGEKDNIHPADKKAAGQRLAYLALANTYGKKGIEYSGPVLNGMTIDGSLVKLTFDHARNGLTTFGKELVNFEVAGENKQFFPARAFITGEGITLISERVQKPVAVRYAFKDFVVGELFNTEGLPASSFRTDDWN